MRYLSVCSGIEAATCAWHPLGWAPVGFSEIEKFPSQVLAHHYPDVPNFGDMTRFKEWPDDLAPDVLVGGTPCQSFSVAGLRKGLADPRGNLALTYLALADRYRPEWLVWENVPGVLSSNGGRDFGAFLGALVELGYGFAYRVLDAQYFGVAQRRRRVFVVANARDWRRAAAVLFERESLSWHPAPRRESRKDLAPTISARPSGGGGLGTDFDLDGGVIPAWPAEVASTLNAAFGDKQGLEDQHALSGASLFVPATAHTLRAEGFDASEDGTGRGTPLVPVHRDVAPTLTGNYWKQPDSSDTSAGPMLVPVTMPTLRAGTPNGGKGHGARSGDSKDEYIVPVAFAQNTRDEVREMPYVGALAAEPGMKQTSYIRQAMAVRRLTPRECERLQGFPDDYTDIRPRGKDTPDGPRYKALGNSMAVPVMAWIGERIAAVAAQDERIAA